MASARLEFDREWDSLTENEKSDVNFLARALESKTIYSENSSHTNPKESETIYFDSTLFYKKIFFNYFDYDFDTWSVIPGNRLKALAIYQRIVNDDKILHNNDLLSFYRRKREKQFKKVDNVDNS